MQRHYTMTEVKRELVELRGPPLPVADRYYEKHYVLGKSTMIGLVRFRVGCDIKDYIPALN